MSNIWEYLDSLEDSVIEKKDEKKFELIKKNNNRCKKKNKNQARKENIRETYEITGGNEKYVIERKYLDMYFAKYFIAEDVKYIQSLDFKDKLEFYIDYNNIPTKLPYKHIKKMVDPNSFEKYITNVHKGQKKLYLSELYFLTRVVEKKLVRPNTIVVYVGAGPGHHLIKLIGLFPQFEYHLYDNVFDKQLESLANVKLFLRFFTVDDCVTYRDKNIIFISDIRNPAIGNVDVDDDDVNVKYQNAIVTSDQKLQEEWVRSISPYASSLKFRLPWVKNQMEYKYLDGEIFVQPFKPKNSSESRLFIYDSKLTKVYDCIEYDSKMFFTNRILRYLYGHHNKENFDYSYMLYIYDYYRKNVNSEIKDLDY